jgi:cell division protein ZapA
MADVTITIGGRPHLVACRDGEEARVRHLGAMLEERWPVAQRAAAGAGGERALLFVALMLADDLDEATAHPPQIVADDAPADAAADESALVRIAEQLESLADALEHSVPSA